MEYADRFKVIRKELGLSQKELGERLELPTINVSRIENGDREVKIDILEKMENIGVNSRWLITGEGEMFLGGGAGVSTELARVKLIDAKASAGPGAIVYEEGHSYISIPAELLYPHDPKTIELIRVDGHSMEPAMYPGDMLAVVSSLNNWVSERYFVIDMYKELRVKRLMRRASGLIAIISENPAFGTEEISEEEFNENVRVVARVVKVIHARDV